MKHFAWMTVPVCLALAGCGGGGGAMIEDVGAGGGGGDDTPPGGGGTLNFTDFLDLDSTQLAGVDASDAGTLTEFAKANAFPTGFYTDASASFNGSMFVQMGTAERYFGGDIDLTLNLTNGTGRGTVGFGSISGTDVENHQTNVDFLDMNVTNISQGNFEGTITGDVAVSFEVNTDLLDTYSFDTTFDAKFVDDGVNGGFLGVVEGTVESGKRGVEDVTGVMAAGRDLFR